MGKQKGRGKQAGGTSKPEEEKKTALVRQGVGNRTKSSKRNELGRKNKTKARRPEEGKAKGKYRKYQGARGAHKSVQHSKHPS